MARLSRTATLVALLLATPVVDPEMSRAAAPAVMTYQGVLIDRNGQPVTGDEDVIVRIWSHPFSSETQYLVYQEIHLDVPLVDGVFAVRVGEGLFPLRPFAGDIFDELDRWVEVEIASQIFAPRKQFSSHARSMRSDRARRAESLGGIEPDEVQPRVSQTCPAGAAMREIPADGSAATCEIDDDTRYTAGTGLALIGNALSLDLDAVQIRIAGSCPAGQAIRAVGQAGVICEIDDDTDTTYSAGAGLSLVGTQLGIAAGGVSTARLVGVINSDLDTGAVDSRAMAPDTLGPGDLAPDSVGSSEIAAGAVGAAELQHPPPFLEFIDSARVQDASLGGADFAAASIPSAVLMDGPEARNATSDLGQFLQVTPVFVASTTYETPAGAGIAIVSASGRFGFTLTAASDAGECELTTGTDPLGTSAFASTRATNAGATNAILSRAFFLTGGVVAPGNSTIQFNLECRLAVGTASISVTDAVLSVLFLPNRY